MTNPQPLDPARHGNLRARIEPEFEKSLGQQALPVTIFEFSRAGNDCPIVFQKNPENGHFQALMLLGLARDENLMYRDGQWQGTYVPEALRLGPFKLLLPQSGAEVGGLGLDVESPLVSDTEGNALFDEQGKPTEFLEQCRKGIETYYQQSNATHALLTLLMEQELLTQQSLRMDVEGERVQIDGLYLVDDQKICNLPDDVALDYYKRGILQAAFAHLMSLRQATRLARMKSALKRAG